MTGIKISGFRKEVRYFLSLPVRQDRRKDERGRRVAVFHAVGVSVRAEFRVAGPEPQQSLTLADHIVLNAAVADADFTCASA